jgi:hypothetical protein
MKTTLAAGREIETVSPDEMAQLLDASTRNWYQERARGLITADFPLWTQTVSNKVVAFPASGDPRMGPRAGMLWAVQRVAAAGLAAGDILSVFRGEAVAANYIGNIQAAAGFLHVGGHGFLLRGEQYLTITGANLSATGLITITGDAIECSELDMYKILGG